MALLQKIKEKLGFGSRPSSSDRESTDSDRGEAAVTVERESDADDAASTETDASAVEVDESGGESDAVDEEHEATDDEAVGADAVDEEHEAVGADAVDEESEATDDEATDDAVDEGTTVDDGAGDTETDETAATDGTPVEQIKGIGPAYAERLGEIGIHTVEDLAGADAAAIAEGTSVGEGRAETWIGRAKEF